MCVRFFHLRSFALFSGKRFDGIRIRQLTFTNGRQLEPSRRTLFRKWIPKKKKNLKNSSESNATLILPDPVEPDPVDHNRKIGSKQHQKGNIILRQI